MDQALLSKAQALYATLARGDREARALAERLKAARQAAYEGRLDPSGVALFNTMTALHWGRLEGDGGGPSSTWQKADDFYQRLMDENPHAWQDLKGFLARAQLGDSLAREALATLKAVYHQRKASVWFPPGAQGAPKTGLYPMPQKNRPGLVFGYDPPSRVMFGAPLSAYAGYALGGMPDIPDVQPIPGQLPIPANTIPAPGQFPALTQTAVQRLLGVIHSARISPGGMRNLVSMRPMTTPPVPVPASMTTGPVGPGAAFSPLSTQRRAQVTTALQRATALRVPIPVAKTTKSPFVSSHF